jgi:hypothetical protein
MRPKLNQRTNETKNGSYGDLKLKTWTQFTLINPFLNYWYDIFHVQKIQKKKTLCPTIHFPTLHFHQH